jgi:hypothetical protein
MRIVLLTSAAPPTPERTIMRQPAVVARCFPLAASAALLLASACGGAHHHLDEYTFADRTLALVVLDAPAPGLITGGYDLRTDDVVELAAKTGSKVMKDVEARRARARMDSATARMRLTDSLAKRALERSSRYLGVRPATSAADADYLLEIHLRNYGLDASGSSSASLYTNAEVVLLDRRTGREIWFVRVHGTDRLTPRVYGTGGVGGSIIAAGTLHTMTVQDFQQALDQLMSLSANVVAEELRSALRDARR